MSDQTIWAQLLYHAVVHPSIPFLCYFGLFISVPEVVANSPLVRHSVIFWGFGMPKREREEDRDLCCHFMTHPSETRIRFRVNVNFPNSLKFMTHENGFLSFILKCCFLSHTKRFYPCFFFKGKFVLVLKCVSVASLGLRLFISASFFLVFSK